ncbi:MAG TPA: GAP family protein [Solirubrobacteraceae bacterium]|jgi:cytochrome c biogenesis protein CcdA
MFRLLGLVLSIGLADSLNPTTIAPALYLAATDHPKARVGQFTAGVFVVYFLGGALIAFGPGELLLALVPKPSHTTRYVLELIAGAAMLVAAALLWRNRARLSTRKAPEPSTEGRSSAILGATITAVELPTAFPYFAVIAALVGSGLGPVHQLILLALFNVCFVLPLLGILATLWWAGDRATEVLGRWRAFLQRHWPVLLSGVALVAGLIVIGLGVTGLTGRARVRHLLHHISMIRLRP